jgi:hypothetical protein
MAAVRGFRASVLIALALVLCVVAAAAGIRHGVDPALLRPVHRVTATLEVPVALWIAWLAWRHQFLVPAAMVALALTALLSVVGIAGGQHPASAIAVVNLLGGLALAGSFAWLLARS